MKIKKYVKPELIDLNFSSARCDCTGGSADFFDCETGGITFNNCHGGSYAGGHCTEHGSFASWQCVFQGSSPVIKTP